MLTGCIDIAISPGSWGEDSYVLRLSLLRQAGPIWEDKHIQEERRNSGTLCRTTQCCWYSTHPHNSVNNSLTRKDINKRPLKLSGWPGHWVQAKEEHRMMSRGKQNCPFIFQIQLLWFFFILLVYLISAIARITREHYSCFQYQETRER